MPTEEDKRKAACTMILMCMQVIIVCSWKRRIAMRAAVAGQPSRARSKAQTGQKRRRSLPGYDKFDDSILLMAEAAKEMASAFDKPIMPRLLPALKGIPELSHGDIRRAMIVFGRDRESAEILVSMDESMRYGFVRDMIG